MLDNLRQWLSVAQPLTTPIGDPGSELEREIQRREATVAALQLAEAKYEEIFRNCVEGIFQSTPKGCYISANPALAAIYGYDSPEEMMACVENIADQLYVDRGTREKFVSEIQEQGVLRDFISRVKRKDGRIIWVRENVRAVRGQGGVILYYEGNVSDITDWKETEEKLIAAKEAAEEANRVKGQFLASMSHELRTPLTAIIGFSEMLLEDARIERKEEWIDDLERILSSSHHLLGIINDLLDLSKIEAGRLELNPEPINVRDLILELADAVKTSVSKRHNHLVVRTGAEDCHAVIDKLRLRKCLLNLVGNACKFTDHGSVTIALDHFDKQGEPWLRLSVSDTGIGMCEEQTAKIFEPFAQADPSVSKKYGGPGLGLAITKRFCDMMRGRIFVKSQKGEGSTFTMEFPTRLPKVTSDTGQLLNRVKALPGARRLLIIEDDHLTSKLLTVALQNAGMETRVARTGADGISQAASWKPEAITLDIGLPDMEGWEVLRKLKEHPATADIPVIIVTIDAARHKAIEMGAEDYLFKPVQPAALIGTLASHGIKSNLPPVLLVNDSDEMRRMTARMLESSGFSVLEASTTAQALTLLSSTQPGLAVLEPSLNTVDTLQLLDYLQSRIGADRIPVFVITPDELPVADRDKLHGKVQLILARSQMRREDFLRFVREAVSVGAMQSHRRTGSILAAAPPTPPV